MNNAKNNLQTSAEQVESHARTLNEQELELKVQELMAAKDNDFLIYAQVLAEKRTQPQSTPNTQTNLSEDVLAIVKGNSSKQKKEEAIKKILDKHLQTQESEKVSINTTKDKAIDDLMAQLNDTNKKLRTEKKKYEKLLNADEKIITPAEYTRRKRLRSIKSKFVAMKSDPKKALAYFLTKTSFLKGGKATAGLKKAGLFLRSLSSFSTMGVEQMIKMKEEIKQAIDDMKPDVKKDTITTQLLKESIIEEVKSTAKSYFEQITKPISTDF